MTLNTSLFTCLLNRFCSPIVILIMMPLLLAACTHEISPGGPQSIPVSPSPTGSIRCPSERPSMCTAQYSPVCATLGTHEKATYSNRCAACADRRVSNYQLGACLSE